MGKRISEHSKNRKLANQKFHPDLNEFKEACKIFPYNNKLYRYFDVCAETFCAFIDREYYRQEQDPTYRSEYIDALKRTPQRKLASNRFYKNIDDGDPASIIFAMKILNGAIEEKDRVATVLKYKEINFKNKAFLTGVAKEFNLSFDQLKAFAKKHFKEDDPDVE